MDGSGVQFLSGSGLSRDKHICVALCYLWNLLDLIHECRAFSYQPSQSRLGPDSRSHPRARVSHQLPRARKNITGLQRQSDEVIRSGSQQFNNVRLVGPLQRPSQWEDQVSGELSRAESWSDLMTSRTA